MKRVFLLTLVILFSLTFRTQGAELKIGYINLNKALNESENGKKASKILKDFAKNKKSILLEKDKELKKLNEEIKKQSSVLNPESRKDKEDELSKLYIDFKRMEKDFQEEFQKKEDKLVQEIHNDLIKIISRIGKEEGYTVIFERGISGVILYSPKQFDMTERVIKKYNEITKAKE